MTTTHTTPQLLSNMALFSLCAIILVSKASGIASTTTTYSDSSCTQELAVSSVFGSFRVSDGEVFLGNFNTCYDGNGASSLTVCDENTGEYGIISYSDESCVTSLLDLSGEPPCVELSDCGEGGGVCSFRQTCSSAEPTIITANRYNFLATEYKDSDCQTPTGKTEILSTTIYGIEGVGDGSCAILGANYFHTACMDDGSTLSQTFGTGDNTCSVEVYSESRSTGDITCDTVEVNGLYYNAVSCTDDASTVGGSPTSSPTPSPISDRLVDSSSRDYASTIGGSPTSSPISDGLVDSSSRDDDSSRDDSSSRDDDDVVESDPSSNIVVIVATTVGVSFLLLIIGGCIFVMCKPCRKECGKKSSGVSDIEEAKNDETVIDCVVGVPTAPSDDMVKGIVYNDIPEAIPVAVPI